MVDGEKMKTSDDAIQAKVLELRRLGYYVDAGVTRSGYFPDGGSKCIGPQTGRKLITVQECHRQLDEILAEARRNPRPETLTSKAQRAGLLIGEIQPGIYEDIRGKRYTAAQVEVMVKERGVS